jgi:hypothetical protein
VPSAEAHKLDILDLNRLIDAPQYRTWKLHQALISVRGM